MTTDPQVSVTVPADRKEWNLCRASPYYWMTRYVSVPDPRGGAPTPFKMRRVQKRVYAALKEKFFKPFCKQAGEIYYRFQQIRLIIVKYRRVGISTLLLLLLMHDTMFWEGTNSRVYMHDSTTAKKTLERCKDILRTIKPKVRPASLRDDIDNAGTLSFSRIRSRIDVGSPGKTKDSSEAQGRGDDVHNLLASEIPRYVYQDEFNTAIMPAARLGNVYWESTPATKGDLFHRTFKDARANINGWLGMFFCWVDDDDLWLPIESDDEREAIMRSLSSSEKRLFNRYPNRMNAERVKWRRHTIRTEFGHNERKFCQEYPEDEEECFAGSGLSFFFNPEIEIKQAFCIHKRSIPARPGAFHVLALDPSKGQGGDFNGIEIFDADTWEQVHEYKNNTTDYRRMPEVLYRLYKSYPGVCAVECNEQAGGSIMASLRKEERYKKDSLFQAMLFDTSAKQEGWHTNSGNKAEMGDDLYLELTEAAQAYGDVSSIAVGANTNLPVGIRLYSQALVNQLGVCLDLGRDAWGAKSPNNDDLVMATAIVVQLKRLGIVSRYRKIYMKELAKQYA